jgi:hypothetical protein
MRIALESLVVFFVPFVCAALLTGCGGAPEPEPEPVEPAPTTTGGETTEPLVLRTTTPVPVPQPAVAREELPEPLQNLWTRTEEVVADGPPEPPLEGTSEALAAWAEDPFIPWVESRRDAIQGAEPFVEALGEDAVARSVAAALFGYMYEDTAAGIRGAPVPEDIANDQELLGVYVETLDTSLQPFAQRALESYAYCATILAQLGDSPWVEWARYCIERGRDVATVFELGGGSAGAAEAPDGDATVEESTP